MIDDRIALPPPDLGVPIDMNRWTEPFWAAADREALAIPRCSACGTWRMPPTPFCPACRSQAIDWVEISGDGILFSYTIVERAIMPGTEASLPYVPAIVALPQAGGVRLITNIVGSEIGRLRIDAPVNLIWYRLASGRRLPQYRLA
ncbi:OB-fold domain-containing protein [Sphingomonas sp. 1P06PA]|uniref:Zn-ribbon domain-containing OB-fold protein n=1 Tax=Sphingomonas sp. 1P06PA TaxID=554121 RepID=UPI0039A63ADC